MKKLSALRLVAVIYVFISLFPFEARARTAQGHPDIWLRNELGEHISPDLNGIEPYSPRRTCGGCHSYATITRGFHFQQGFSKSQKSAAPGLYGAGLDLSNLPEPVAPKMIRDQFREGLSAYDWISAGSKPGSAREGFSPAAGWFIPGGGPLEYGRSKSGRADTARNLIEGERGGKSQSDGDYSSRFTPDRLSHFRESGIVEADCLICHFTNYDMGRRNAQLSARNYRWAATAGAGLGSIKGAIFTYAAPNAGPENPRYLSGNWNFLKRPVVEYNWNNEKLFSKEGRLRGNLLHKNVTSQSCLQCHSILDAAATGTSHSPKYDIHAKAGFACTDCHALSGNNARQRLSHEMSRARTCAGCHIERKYKPRKGLPEKARNPAKVHAMKLPRNTFHFHLVSCTGCHAIGQGARGGYLVDRSTGVPAWYTADTIERVPGVASLAQATPRSWRPWIFRHDAGGGEMYTAGTPRVTQWFGEMATGRVTPLRLDMVRKALANLKLTSPKIKGDQGRETKAFTVAGESDIGRAIKALQAAGVKNAVFVADKVYRLENNKVVASGGTVPFWRGLVHHDIQRKAYGSGGCRDCHADNSPFFTKQRVTNIGRFLKEDYPTPREPNAVQQMKEWGFESVPPMKR